MKKLLFCILLITFQCSVLLAQSDGAIYIDTTQPDNTNNRLTIKLINNESVCQIETALSSSESYTLKIQEYRGDVICDIDLITDGNIHTYMLQGLQKGIYVLLLRTPQEYNSTKFVID